MLCVQAWAGVVRTKPNTPNKPNKQQVEVWARLGGRFLGCVDKLEPQSYSFFYRVLRNLQDQIVKIFSHPSRPSRYLAVFVGDTRLTLPSFPFVEESRFFGKKKTFKLLFKATRFDVMYDEDLGYALKRLEGKGFQVDNTIAGQLTTASKTVPSMLPVELEAFTFGGESIRSIETVIWPMCGPAVACLDLFPCLDFFPCLECLVIRIENGRNHFIDVDFERLSQTKVLTKLVLPVRTLTPQVGHMTSLRELFVHAKTPCDIPTELGCLTNLVKLGLYDNFVNSIPSQLGNLGDLQCLFIVQTKVSGRLPSALCRLTRLKTLSFANSRQLTGKLTQEFSNLVCLDYINLAYSQVQINGVLDETWSRWRGRDQTWSRNLVTNI